MRVEVEICRNVVRGRSGPHVKGTVAVAHVEAVRSVNERDRSRVALRGLMETEYGVRLAVGDREPGSEQILCAIESDDG